MAEKKQRKQKELHSRNKEHHYQKTHKFFQKLTKTHYSGYTIEYKDRQESVDMLEKCSRYAKDEREKEIFSRLLLDVQNAVPETYGIIASKVCDMLDMIINPLHIPDSRTEWFGHSNSNQIVLEHEKVKYVQVPRMYVFKIRERCERGELSSIKSSSSLYKYLALYTAADTSAGQTKMYGWAFNHKVNGLVANVFPGGETKVNFCDLLLPDKRTREKCSKKQKLEMVLHILEKLQEQGLIEFYDAAAVLGESSMQWENPVICVNIKDGFEKTNTRGCRKYSGYVLLDKSLLPCINAFCTDEGVGMSEADMILDMFIHTVTVDPDVVGSYFQPVVCFPVFRVCGTYGAPNGFADPRFKIEDLAGYWKVSRSKAFRKIQKFAKLGLIHHYYYQNTKWSDGHLITMDHFMEYRFVDWYDPESRRFKRMNTNTFPAASPLTMGLCLETWYENVTWAAEISQEMWDKAMHMVHEGDCSNIRDLDFFPDTRIMEEYMPFHNEFSADEYDVTKDMDVLKEQVKDTSRRLLDALPFFLVGDSCIKKEGQDRGKEEAEKERKAKKIQNIKNGRKKKEAEKDNKPGQLLPCGDTGVPPLQHGAAEVPQMPLPYGGTEVPQMPLPYGDTGVPQLPLPYGDVGVPQMPLPYGNEETQLSYGNTGKVSQQPYGAAEVQQPLPYGDTEVPQKSLPYGNEKIQLPLPYGDTEALQQPLPYGNIVEYQSSNLCGDAEVLQQPLPYPSDESAGFVPADRNELPDNWEDNAKKPEQKTENRQEKKPRYTSLEFTEFERKSGMIETYFGERDELETGDLLEDEEMEHWRMIDEMKDKKLNV